MLQHEPVARAELLVRRPVAEVFEAWTDPNVTSKFWFSRGARRLHQGPSVRWFWDPFGIHADVNVIVLELNKRIVIEWPTPVEWTFEPRGEDATYVTITASGFEGSDDEKVAQAIDAMGGFTAALVACKAYLEHGVLLNLIADYEYDGAAQGGPDAAQGGPDDT